MSYFADSFHTAVELIRTFDPEVVQTATTSLSVSAVAILIASIIGIPVGILLGLGRFSGQRLVLTVLNTMMALPTVVVGLVIYGLISRQGPLGEYGLLFTQEAMVIGQVILAIPIVAHYTVSALNGADSRILPTLQTLGAGPILRIWLLLKELRFAVLAGVIAGFGRVIAEVGVAMMLGGNIRGTTRTMTTAIALETSRGEFAFALALGMVLLGVALLVNALLHSLQRG